MKNEVAAISIDNQIAHTFEQKCTVARIYIGGVRLKVSSFITFFGIEMIFASGKNKFGGFVWINCFYRLVDKPVAILLFCVSQPKIFQINKSGVGFCGLKTGFSFVMRRKWFC
jgi:hypothetical protein